LDFDPKFRSEKFRCPTCTVVSQQSWFDVDVAAETANKIISHIFYEYRTTIPDYYQEAVAKFLEQVQVGNKRHMAEFVPNGFAVATCSSCSEITLWVHEELVYPKYTPVAAPNSDMADDVQALYIEASTIVVESPKGATALLRLSLQLLLKQLGKPGKNINNDIKDLVSDGLSPKIQKALDLLRVVGNNAVHPGQIDLEDDRNIALKLFQILNFIADEMITKPKELDHLYEEVVPEDTKQHITARDGKAG
jgi:hypothetical protein